MAHLSATSATVEAYARLKNMILTNELSPGVELREGGLADATGYGRTPVREALQRLVHEGFVEVRPRQGYRVRQLSVAGVRDLFEMRLILEPAAVQLAIERATDAELATLSALAHATYGVDRPSYEQFLIDNREIHVRIAEVSGNARLADSLRILLEEMQRLYFVTLGSRAAVGEQLHEHHDLFDAMVERAAATARGLVVDQIESSRRQVIDALLGGAAGLSPGVDQLILFGSSR
ncbi:GntR family transcriptional regulator [Occultella glacieicola]|uniref:GntR family transcriptional regulator n=1 Tax=Occultella glacieicola TaxID=2518684 RepID=A0ABY2DX38_9MICO|nr:GntR family transcriptional regulator [Occultella glacieicola]TDE88538.1 GntR family transcriptional regulator [Occultella glacieicola]